MSSLSQSKPLVAQVINNVLSGLVREEAPLADSTAYRNIVEALMTCQRGPALTAIRSCLSRPFQSQQLVATKWHGDPKPLTGMDGGPLPGLSGQAILQTEVPLLPFQMTQELVKKHTEKYSKEPDAYSCLHWVDDVSQSDSLPGFKPCETGSISHLEGPDCNEQIACVVTLSALWVDGFVTPDHLSKPPVPQLTLTHFGIAALEFSQQFMAEGLRLLSMVKSGEV